MNNKSTDKISEYINKFRESLKNPKTTMTPEKLKDIKKKVSESLSLDRQRLIVRQPFTGGMLMHFEMIPIRDYRCGTAMTDGSRIFFDIDFYSKLNEDERVFVLAHECWHCIYLHFLRRHGRDTILWNIATDCEINYMLKSQNFKAPLELCFPERDEEGLNAEEIYEKLLKKAKKNKTNSQNKNEKDSNSGNSNQISNGTNKSKSGLTGQFDKHFEENENKDGNGSILPTDQWGEKGEDPDYNPRINCDVAEKVREAVISEAQKMERSQGKLPGGLESIINKYRKPELNWKELLCQEVTKCYSDKREWLPPNRRYVHRGLYLQSQRGEKLKCTVAVDTSGSCTADIPKFMGELVGLLNSFSNYEMTFIQCDAEIQSVEKYDDFNPFPLEDCNKIKWKGFGGTDFKPVFKYLEENSEEQPNILIFLTDGYGTAPENPPPYNLLWILTADGSTDFCNYGTKIYFKEKINIEEYIQTNK